MEDNTKQINNSIASGPRWIYPPWSGRSDSTEITEKDSKPDVLMIKKPELLSLKCRNLEKVQASESTVDIKIKEPKVEEALQIINNVSSDNYTREHVQLSDLKVYLNVPINEIGAFMSPTNMSSDENNIEIINVSSISDDLKNAEGQSMHAGRRVRYRNDYTHYTMIVLGVMLSSQKNPLLDNPDLTPFPVCIREGIT
ncbi:unnamed protein product [Aphis gossypii]|uniref:Uncharacterized protein n=1 Tax=Aphis gossypii TaxID=80765 RepID=A0A9P0J2F0_APHGO|nr:unnamed protein product [Aphis gossypii]